MNRLQGKRLLITGGTTGIGLETAKQFLLEGARVIITGQNPDTLAQAQQELSKEVIVIESDAGKVDEQQRLVAEIDSNGHWSRGAFNLPWMPSSIILPVMNFMQKLDFEKWSELYFSLSQLLRVLAQPLQR